MTRQIGRLLDKEHYSVNYIFGIVSLFNMPMFIDLDRHVIPPHVVLLLLMFTDM